MKTLETQKVISTCAEKLYDAVKDENVNSSFLKFDSYWVFFSELFPYKLQDDIVCNEWLREVAKAFYMAGATEGNTDSFMDVCEKFKEKYPLVFDKGTKKAQ